MATTITSVTKTLKSSSRFRLRSPQVRRQDEVGPQTCRQAGGALPDRAFG
jgi:hypothetical protein